MMKQNITKTATLTDKIAEIPLMNGNLVGIAVPLLKIYCHNFTIGFIFCKEIYEL